MNEQEKHQDSNPEQPATAPAEQGDKTDDLNPQVKADAEASVDTPADEAVADDAGEELIAAHEEIAKLKDAFLRAKAEEDNVRRRAEKEVSNSRKFAVEGFAKEMFSVYDSLKMAVSVELAEDADDAIKSVHEGVEITLKQLQAALNKFSISEVAPAVGDKLDPNLHQAMSMIDSEEVESGAIINVIQSGFTLHDRLLRPAMVVVAK